MDLSLNRILQTLRRRKKSTKLVTNVDDVPPLLLGSPMSAMAKYRMARSWRQMETDMVKDRYRNFHTFIPRYAIYGSVQPYSVGGIVLLCVHPIWKWLKQCNLIPKSSNQKRSLYLHLKSKQTHYSRQCGWKINFTTTTANKIKLKKLSVWLNPKLAD